MLASREYPDRKGTGRRMEPFLLLELAAGPAYGYELARAIAAHPSTVYNLLRSLEEAGYVTSSWSVRDTRSPRHIYQLTPTGITYLHERAADLRCQQERTAQFLNRYQQRFGEGSSRGDPAD